MNAHQRIFLFLLAVGLSACNDNGAVMKSTDIAVLFQRVVITQGNQRWAEFVVTNATPHSIYFAGYGSAQPIYTLQRRNGWRWEQQQFVRCGTGLDTQELRAGGVAKFVAFVGFVGSNTTIRAGVACADRKDSVRRHYWSDAVRSK